MLNDVESSLLLDECRDHIVYSCSSPCPSIFSCTFLFFLSRAHIRVCVLCAVVYNSTQCFCSLWSLYQYILHSALQLSASWWPATKARYALVADVGLSIIRCLSRGHISVIRSSTVNELQRAVLSTSGDDHTVMTAPVVWLESRTGKHGCGQAFYHSVCILAMHIAAVSFCLVALPGHAVCAIVGSLATAGVEVKTLWSQATSWLQSTRWVLIMRFICLFCVLCHHKLYDIVHIVGVLG